MTEWSFLTNHARVLVCIAHDPGVRLRDIATTLDITERSAYSIVTDLTTSGYVVKAKDGRRNRYQIQAHLPLREAITQQRTIGEVLDVLVESDTRQRRRAHRVIRRPVAPRRPARPTTLHHHRGQAVHPVKVGVVTTGHLLVTPLWSLRCCGIHVSSRPSEGKRRALRRLRSPLVMANWLSDRTLMAHPRMHSPNSGRCR